MLQAVAMQRINLKFLTPDAQLIAQALADFGVFNPEILETDLNSHISTISYADLKVKFNLARNRLEKIMQFQAIKFSNFTISYQAISDELLTTANNNLGEIWQQLSKLEEQKHQLQEQQASYKQLLATLEKFLQLDLDLELLRKPQSFLNLQVGIVDLRQLQQLQEALSKTEHLLSVFHQNHEQAYCIIAGSVEFADQTAIILHHAEFQAINLPPEFDSYPQQVQAELSTQIIELGQQVLALNQQQQDLISQQQNELNQAYTVLQQLSCYVGLMDKVGTKGSLSVISGWVPQHKIADLHDFLARKLTQPYLLDSRPPLPSERHQVPTLMPESKLLRSYQALVKNYGIPRYGEFDPSWLFMVTFLLMFGAMFGDVGQGLVIMLAGWLLRKPLQHFSVFFIFAGLASIGFGLLYGSVFGVKGVILPTIWVSPLYHPFYMLQVALYWGVGFILLAMLLKTINNWRFGNYAAAVFGNNGLAGIALYITGFLTLKTWLESGILSEMQMLITLLPLSLILAHAWHENHLPLGERALVAFIEGFETLMGYLANTLSFLRVAAFSLNHAALAIVVFTLANMMGDVGYWVTFVLGNIVIIILKGVIVTIQILRLEYYEGFSRFFSGDGREFQPLKANIKLNA